jgi:hypothetical protein
LSCEGRSEAQNSAGRLSFPPGGNGSLNNKSRQYGCKVRQLVL